MTFSPLEAALMAFVASILTAIVARMLAIRVFMSRAECLKNHLATDLADHAAAKTINGIEAQIGTIFSMIRGMVVYSDLPPEIKEKILNSKVDCGPQQ